METSPNQTLSGAAINGSWGVFNSGDNYPDLAVTNGTSEIRIYNSNNDGTVNSTPTTISTAATQVIMAPMDKPTYDVGSNKWDLLSYYGNTISVRINTNSNGFESPQTFQFGTGEGSSITSMAVGDINGDDFNDLVVVGYSGNTRAAKLYLNDTSGTLNTTPAWTYTSNDGLLPHYPQVAIGDMGTPNDTSKNDGHNDLVIAGYEAWVLVFLNQGSGTYFGSTADQSFPAGGPQSAYPRRIQLADVQNTGGLSLVYDQTPMIYINKHTGDPAPAPPKNVGVVSVPRGYGNYNDAKVTWRANTERDLAGYELWRRVTGICGNGTWYLRAELDGTETEYIDQLGTVTENGECLAEYKLLAIDAEDHESDFSAIVEIEFGSDMWKGTGGKPDASSVPVDYALHAAYPNPFNPSTEIKFDLPEDGFVTLHVFDVLGRKVGEIVNRNYAAGYHSATWNAGNAASSVYFARLTVTDELGRLKYSRINKLLLNK